MEEALLTPPVLRKQQAVGIPMAGEASAVTMLQQQSDVPFFVHFPRSGGSTLLEIMSYCIGLVLASDVGARDGHGSDPNLQVIETPAGSYVNVDTNSQAGLALLVRHRVVLLERPAPSREAACQIPWRGALLQLAPERCASTSSRSRDVSVLHPLHAPQERPDKV